MEHLSATEVEDILDLGASCAGGPSVVLVRAVSPAAKVEAAWVPGPLPVLQPQNQGSRERDAIRPTDEQARRTLVASQPGNVLYGHAGRRWHRLTTLQTSGLTVLASELWFDASQSWGYLVVHLTTGQPELETHLDAISPLLLPGSARAAEFWASLIAGGASYTDSIVRRLSFVDVRAEGESALPVAYALVSGAKSRRFDDAATRSQTHELTISRADWSALVLRDGGTLVVHQTTDEPFAESLRMQTHTVYTDALLLALIQRHEVDVSSKKAVDASLAIDSLVELETSHFEFKRVYWRTALTHKRTSPLDTVLHAFQEELLTHADFSEVEERVRDGAQLARTLRDEKAKVSQDRIERTVQDASVVIGSFALAYTAAAVVADPGVLNFLLATVVGLLAVLIAFAVLRITGRRAG